LQSMDGTNKPTRAAFSASRFIVKIEDYVGMQIQNANASSQ
jgi:hypothetical protein